MKKLITILVIVVLAIQCTAQETIEKKGNCSFVLKYEGRVIAKGSNVEFNFKEDLNRELYKTVPEDKINPMLTENSPDCIVYFRIDRKYESILANTFISIDKPVHFEIKTKLYFPNSNYVVKGKGYITQYYRFVCQLEVLSGDAHIKILD